MHPQIVALGALPDKLKVNSMNRKLLEYYHALKAGGLTPEQAQNIEKELYAEDFHDFPQDRVSQREAGIEFLPDGPKNVYDHHDLMQLQDMPRPVGTYISCLRSIDELLEKDKQREKDGFPKKIRVGRMVKPGRSGKDKIVVVPTTVEEKFIHDRLRRPPEEDGQLGGSGEGEEGEIIGE